MGLGAFSKPTGGNSLDTAQAIFDQGKRYLDENKVEKALSCFAQLLNRDFSNPTLLYMVSDCMIRLGWNGPAINLLGVCLQAHPQFQEAWNNLGVSFRHENYHDLARAAWEKAIAVKPTPEAIGNLATLSADMGDPDDAINWCRQALELNPEHWQSYWNMSLAVLTKREWAEGWDLYEYRKRLSHYDSRATIDAPDWDGSPVEHLYLHGEQGVGDEVMFTSMLPDILRRAKRVTVEAHKKYAGLLQQSFPQVAVISKESEAAGSHFDAKCRMGSAARFFRRSREDFPGVPYLHPDPARVAHYRGELAKLGPGPYLAIAWVGGTKKTRVEDRSIPLSSFRPILNKYTCVSAQYAVVADEALHAEREAAGLVEIDPECAGGDMHAQAALFAACDAVVTVCQTAVHVAGAVGTPAFVMVPNRPSWRYGIAGADLPWYDSVRLFRQGPSDTWLQVLHRVQTALNGQLRQREAA
jgi:tetratricopeptide (TPR) repeat protein